MERQSAERGSVEADGSEEDEVEIHILELLRGGTGGEESSGEAEFVPEDFPSGFRKSVGGSLHLSGWI